MLSQFQPPVVQLANRIDLHQKLLDSRDALIKLLANRPVLSLHVVAMHQLPALLQLPSHVFLASTGTPMADLLES